LKYIKLFEDFDLDKFMEDPESQFHDDTDPNIIEGDWVTSYRGPAKVLSISGEMARVELINGPRSIVSVPFEFLTKITKEEALKLSRNKVDSKKELTTMNQEMEAVLKAAISEDDETGDEIFSGNMEKTISYLEEFLVDLIDLKNKDSYSPYYTEYGTFTSNLANLCYLMIDKIDKDIQNTGNQSEVRELENLKKKIEVIQDKFFEISS
jgi:hypothetical protein